MNKNLSCNHEGNVLCDSVNIVALTYPVMRVSVAAAVACKATNRWRTLLPQMSLFCPPEPHRMIYSSPIRSNGPLANPIDILRSRLVNRRNHTRSPTLPPNSHSRMGRRNPIHLLPKRIDLLTRRRRPRLRQRMRRKTNLPRRGSPARLRLATLAGSPTPRSLRWLWGMATEVTLLQLDLVQARNAQGGARAA